LIHPLIEQLAAAAPIRDEDLVGETEAPAARALLEHVLATPVRRHHARRRRLVAPAALIAAAAAVLAAVVVTTTGDGSRSAAAAALSRLAAVAARQTVLVPGPGQYLYTKSLNAYENTVVPAGGASAAYSVLVPHVREIWLGPDGGRLYETSGAPQFLTARDRERWIAAGRRPLTESPSENTLPAARPLDLPDDPDALYQRLEREAATSDNPVPAEMFTLVGDALRETSATAAQRAALYQVAARIPGVELVGPVTDGTGRAGTAVAMTRDGVRFTLIFDPQTSALLEEDDTALAGNHFGLPAGTRVGYATYLTQAIVSSNTARP
jgi:hypothetical protein